MSSPQRIEEEQLFKELFATAEAPEQPRRDTSSQPIPPRQPSFPELHPHYASIRQLYTLREACLVASNLEDVESITQSLAGILGRLRSSFAFIVDGESD